MARKPSTNPRKRASQERSRATVDALVEATARILVKDGFDKASTNRIAERAGVSIGSLYQYFPSKEALVAAVVDRHNQELMEIVRHALLDVGGLSPEAAVRRLVAIAIQAHRKNPKLHRVLTEQIPRTDRLDAIGALNRETLALFHNYLERHRRALRVTDIGLAAYVCVTTIEALTHNTVLHRPDMLSDSAVANLTDEATRLLTGYLVRQASRGPDAPRRGT
jgi:AcrR family transcriptional regulator